MVVQSFLPSTPDPENYYELVCNISFSVSVFVPDPNDFPTLSYFSSGHRTRLSLFFLFEMSAVCIFFIRSDFPFEGIMEMGLCSQGEIQEFFKYDAGEWQILCPGNSSHCGTGLAILC